MLPQQGVRALPAPCIWALHRTATYGPAIVTSIGWLAHSSTGSEGWNSITTGEAVKSPELQASMIHDLILLSYGGLRTIIVSGHIPVIAVVAADDGKTQA